MVPMQGVDRRRQTGQFAELTCYDIVAADVVRHVRATGLIDKRVTPYLSRLGDRIP